MDENFIRERLTQLRLQKNVSEYKMSYDLGHSKSYIQSISSGRAMPSMSEFLYMCEYLGVTPEQFFAQDNENPILYEQAVQELKKMKEKDLALIIELAARLNE